MVVDVGEAWREIKRGLSGKTDEEPTETAENRTSISTERVAGVEKGPAHCDPHELRSRMDIIRKTNVYPDEYFVSLIEKEGGKLPQKAFAEYTALSSSTISRLLQEMEDDGQIVRVQIGREKIVCLPEHDPGVDFSVLGGNEESSPV